MNTNKPLDMSAVFGGAARQNIISQATLRTLTTMDLGDQIQNAMGISADDIESSEVYLLSILLDDSGSIAEAHNEEPLRQGVNKVLTRHRRQSVANDVLVHLTRLNHGTLIPFSPVKSAPDLDDKNFRASGGTPLYDMSITLLGTVLAKEREFAAQGVPVRTATLIVSDSADLHSRHTAADVATVVQDMRRRENHIIAAMGIHDGRTDFRQVFRDMGIEDAWILDPNSDQDSIDAAFEIFSKSSLQASQGAAAFSKLGGLKP